MGAPMCCTEQPVGYGRKRFALVALDGEFRVSAVAPVLMHLITARNKAGNADLGIGVASMSGFSSTFKALQVCPHAPAQHRPESHPLPKANLAPTCSVSCSFLPHGASHLCHCSLASASILLCSRIKK